MTSKLLTNLLLIYPTIIALIIILLVIISYFFPKFLIFLGLYGLYKIVSRQGFPKHNFRRLEKHLDISDYSFIIKKKPKNLEDRKYIFSCHPHGVYNIGMLLGIYLDGCKISELWPQLNTRLFITNKLFYIPFIDYLASNFGLSSAKKDYIDYSLKNGETPIILSGGAFEIDKGGTKKIPINIHKRNGLFKIAKENNTKIIPILVDNENDTWELRNKVGFTIGKFRWFENIFPIGIGKYGIFPIHKEYHYYFGEPIEVENRTQHQIKQDYINQIKQIAKENKLEIEIF
jgi:hypothetical protein